MDTGRLVQIGQGLQIDKIRRHIFLCCDQTKPKCAPKEVGLESWDYLKRRLAELGHELRRPEADLLRDGIYELRARLGTVNYRILYFFHGRNVAVLAHAITKENEIPVVEINRAVARKRTFIASPAAHTLIGDIENA